MSIEISRETEASLANEARRHGISVDALLERLMNERRATSHAAGAELSPELPVWHLAGTGDLHRRDRLGNLREYRGRSQYRRHHGMFRRA